MPLLISPQIHKLSLKSIIILTKIEVGRCSLLKWCLAIVFVLDINCCREESRYETCQ